jgi:hypothetical protein
MKTALRIIALLAFAVSAAAPAQSPSHPPTTLVVLANRQTQKRLWPVLVSTLRRDAAAASQSAPVDGDPQIILGGGDIPGPVFPSRIEVELLGACDDPWNANPPAKNGPLGYVREDSGMIAPIIYVDCAQVNQLLSPQNRSMTQNQRLRITSEVISHVILHEWIHIATQSPAHTSRGIMQSSLSIPELTAPIADTGSAPAKSQKKSKTESGSDSGPLVRGFTVLIGDQR